MIEMMKGVIRKGTGRRLVWGYGMENVEVAGKTGTTNENRDAWFMCITPKLVAGAWVGGEDQSIHLTRRAEGSVMALPIVGDFLRRVHKDESLNVKPTDKFTRPTHWVEAECEDAESPASEAALLKDEFFE